jgi:hypothetical protein
MRNVGNVSSGTAAIVAQLQQMGYLGGGGNVKNLTVTEGFNKPQSLDNSKLINSE